MMITQANLQKKKIHTHYGKIVKTLVFKYKKLEHQRFLFQGCEAGRSAPTLFLQRLGVCQLIHLFVS